MSEHTDRTQPDDPEVATTGKPDRKRKIRGEARPFDSVGKTEIAEHHVAYAEMGQTQGWYFENPSEEPYFPTGNPKVWFRWQGDKHHRDFMLNLGSMTAKEIEVMREFINWSLDRALPHAQSADERATQDTQEGKNVTHARLMRRLPVFATRERGVREYHEGVPSRPDWLADANSDDLRDVLARGFGNERKNVSDDSAPEAGTGNDES